MFSLVSLHFRCDVLVFFTISLQFCYWNSQKCSTVQFIITEYSATSSWKLERHKQNPFVCDSVLVILIQTSDKRAKVWLSSQINDFFQNILSFIKILTLIPVFKGCQLAFFWCHFWALDTFLKWYQSVHCSVEKTH